MRTFIALTPTREDKKQIAQWCNNTFGEQTNAVPTDNLHITLAFLGETTATDCERLAAMPAFNCQLALETQGLGYFKQPGILYLAIKKNDAIQQLRMQLMAQIPKDLVRRSSLDFIPHISLYRNIRPDIAEHLIDTIKGPDLTMTFCEYGLYESVAQQRHAPLYKQIMGWPGY